jgi:hypothetical protein
VLDKDAAVRELSMTGEVIADEQEQEQALCVCLVFS